MAKHVEDFGGGPCAKQTVTAVIVTASGDRFTATNHCDRPQATCPRAGMPTGVGYELCHDVCGQRAHAEVAAITLALGHGADLVGARMAMSGHTYACGSCLEAAAGAGVSITIDDATVAKLERITQIDFMFDAATGWGSWMVTAANDRERLVDDLQAAGWPVTHDNLARCGGERTD